MKGFLIPTRPINYGLCGARENSQIRCQMLPIKHVLLMKSQGQREMELLRGYSVVLRPVLPKLHDRLAVIKGKRGQDPAMLAQKPSKNRDISCAGQKVVARKRRRC
ncbi:uncharacterized protein BDCG_06776 [Blastomyces dermatitidis ER-3]|uniref:Uncharacterized protein n=1 Tax=Ajellomyces dermatitidis (strain ER-3 / ATCC MYA-2586) TaxID=559297 RepID=A0ABP2F406_AJEDR|nr:uncharacterized protein BDCG_06776 [Blastomyces dermatitidis ER-3]EEQ91656.1 hypothetical protein BDCG_06776 [Blastomyces dermatitidis ER-3]